MRDVGDLVGPSCQFIPDPNRWALVMIDWFTVYDVLGWNYDPTTNYSRPVISTRISKGASIYWGDPNFVALVPRWDGIVFGRGVWDSKKSAPKKIRDAVDYTAQRWYSSLLTDLAKEM
jgi:hypothetical protein